jgi:ABC-type multidrug transport system ATPase subunit
MIEYIQVSKSFAKKNVLRNFSMDCMPGRITCLVGKNGAGKSTLVNLSMGLLKLDHGTVKILGERIDRRNRAVVGRVGYVLEEPLFVESFSAREQLEFVGRLHRLKNLVSRVDELLHYFELPPENKKWIGQYSTGMKAKVSLACAVLHRPEVLILDEPFDGLDLPTYDKVLAFLRNYADQGNCILITTHLVDVISEIGDQVALMKDGKLHFQYSFHELQEKSRSFQQERSPIREYLMNQLLETSGITT